MELRNINTFLHIAELHSFSRTARHLGYSQSAVSSQIAQLEAELGAPLFDRVGKTVRLTDAGQTFLGYARTLLATAQQAQAALQPAKQISGSLRIALADSVCSTFLPGLLKRYHALCPQVELVLCTTTADGMLQMLGTNQVDLAYTLDQPLLQPNLVLAADVPEPVCFIAPSGHPLAGQAEVSLEELTQQEFLLTERGMSYRDALDQCLAARGLALHPYLELGSAALLCQMVEQGMGLSFLPEYIVRPALAAGNLARLNVPDCAVEMHRQLFYHRDKWLTPQMKAFIELVRPLLDSLSALAKELDMAVLLISHMSKPGPGVCSALDRLLGSSDFRNAARSILIVGRAPDDPDTRVFAHAKNSLGIPGQSQKYHIGLGGTVAYDGPCDLTADRIIQESGAAQRTAPPAATLNAAVEALDKQLGFMGWVEYAEVVRLCAQHGFSERTMHRARIAMELKTIHLGKYEERKTLWYRSSMKKEDVIADYHNQNEQLLLATS